MGTLHDWGSSVVLHYAPPVTGMAGVSEIMETGWRATFRVVVGRWVIRVCGPIGINAHT
jgi:hypothetical protein